MSDFYTVESIVNQAMDAAALDFTIGSITEGTRPAQVALRSYTTCMRQLLRSAHWTFARKEGPLQLVADASGQTSGVGTLVPGGFVYSYSMPADCMKVRFIPASYFNVNPPVPSDNIVPDDSDAPLMTGLGSPPYGQSRMIPSRFLIANDPNYVPDGASNNLPGVAPIGQTVICSNVQNAKCVYTTEASWPNLWDELFRGAMVAFLASEIVLSLAKDKKFGLVMRDRNIAIAKDKIREARATSGNETWTSSDLSVDWMRVRMSGGFGRGYGWGGAWGPGGGYLFGGYDGIFFSDNSSAY